MKQVLQPWKWSACLGALVPWCLATLQCLVGQCSGYISFSVERPEYLSAHYTLSSPCLPFIHFDPDSSGGGHLFVFQNVPKGLCEVFCWGMDAAPEQKWSCMLVDWSLHIEVAFELHLKVLPCAAILSPKTAQRRRCKSAEKLHTEALESTQQVSAVCWAFHHDLLFIHPMTIHWHPLTSLGAQFQSFSNETKGFISNDLMKMTWYDLMKVDQLQSLGFHWPTKLNNVGARQDELDLAAAVSGECIASAASSEGPAPARSKHSKRSATTKEYLQYISICVN